jgi:ferrous iron transport protein A
MSLHDLPLHTAARITAVRLHGEHDPVAQRLDELGFVPGELVRVIGRGPFGREPIAVQVGFTRFALRRAEAERVLVEPVMAAAGGSR